MTFWSLFAMGVPAWIWSISPLYTSTRRCFWLFLMKWILACSYFANWPTANWWKSPTSKKYVEFISSMMKPKCIVFSNTSMLCTNCMLNIHLISLIWSKQRMCKTVVVCRMHARNVLHDSLFCCQNYILILKYFHLLMEWVVLQLQMQSPVGCIFCNQVLYG